MKENKRCVYCGENTRTDGDGVLCKECKQKADEGAKKVVDAQIAQIKQFSKMLGFQI